MEKYLIRSCVKPFALALAIAASPVAFAADDSQMKTLNHQMSSGNKQAAWKQAQAMRPQWESDPDFDYLYGLLAYDQGHYNEAQFSLERVTLAEPGNVRARLALAKAYYQLGDEHSAMRQFQSVKQSAPPAHIMREVNHYLTQMGEGQSGTLNGFVEGGIGHDSNVSAISGDGTIDNPLFDPLDVTSDPYILLDPNSRQQSDMYDYMHAGLDYYQPMDTDTGFEARGRYSSRNNFSSDRYDSNIYRGSLGIVQIVGKDQLRATITAQDYRLSDSDYQSYYSLSGDWTRYNFGGWNVSAAVFLNQLSYEDDPLRDVYQYMGNLAIQRQIGRLSHSLGLILGDESAEHSQGDHNARSFQGLYYDTSYDLTGGHLLFSRAYYQQGEQKDEDPFFLQERDDTYHQLSVGWNWQLNKPLRLRTELIYDHNDSDVDYYSYERTRLQTGLRYSF